MKKIIKFIRNMQIAWYHAAYHRNMKKADSARIQRDIIMFKQHIYRAEDSWRKVVILTEKNKDMLLKNNL
jgi:hypothetical protein